MSAIRFPFHFGFDGEVVTTNDPAVEVSDRLNNLLGTMLGERVMRPTYGASMHDYLFEPTDDLTMQSIDARVTDAISLWEPDLVVDSVDVSADDLFEPTRIDIEIQYRFTSQDEVDDTIHVAQISVGGSVTEIT